MDGIKIKYKFVAFEIYAKSISQSQKYKYKKKFLIEID